MHFTHERIGTPVNWVLTAVGRVYLANCPEAEREKILALLRKSEHPENRLARDSRRLDRILAETRTQGYGVRDPAFVGGAYGHQLPDGLAAIAVPLVDRRRVHGVINIIWVRAARKIEDMARDHLADLQSAAAEIVVSLRNQTRGT
jgi:IclR family mhp operon transcriptional activator